VHLKVSTSPNRDILYGGKKKRNKKEIFFFCVSGLLDEGLTGNVSALTLVWDNIICKADKDLKIFILLMALEIFLFSEFVFIVLAPWDLFDV